MDVFSNDLVIDMEVRYHQVIDVEEEIDMAPSIY